MTESPIGNRQSAIGDLLARPDEQRLREYKYRFSQAVVFGLPVIALQLWGGALGGPEAERWVGILQALLAGWVAYVGAAGMLFEGLVLLFGVSPRRLTADLPLAMAAALTYLYSLASVLHVFVDGRPAYQPLLFHWCVTLLALWTGLQWLRWSRRTRTAPGRIAHPPEQFDPAAGPSTR